MCDYRIFLLSPEARHGDLVRKLVFGAKRTLPVIQEVEKYIFEGTCNEQHTTGNPDGIIHSVIRNFLSDGDSMATIRYPLLGDRDPANRNKIAGGFRLPVAERFHIPRAIGKNYPRSVDADYPHEEVKTKRKGKVVTRSAINFCNPRTWKKCWVTIVGEHIPFDWDIRMPITTRTPEVEAVTDVQEIPPVEEHGPHGGPVPQEVSVAPQPQQATSVRSRRSYVPRHQSNLFEGTDPLAPDADSDMSGSDTEDDDDDVSMHRTSV